MGWGGCGYELINESFSVSNRARGKHSRNSDPSAARYAFKQVSSLKQETLHDLTDFHVERATALHYNKLSCFHSR